MESVWGRQSYGTSSFKPQHNITDKEKSGSLLRLLNSPTLFASASLLKPQNMTADIDFPLLQIHPQESRRRDGDSWEEEARDRGRDVDCWALREQSGDDERWLLLTLLPLNPPERGETEQYTEKRKREKRVGWVLKREFVKMCKKKSEQQRLIIRQRMKTDLRFLRKKKTAREIFVVFVSKVMYEIKSVFFPVVHLWMTF